jgi:hypothetical protein
MAKGAKMAATDIALVPPRTQERILRVDMAFSLLSVVIMFAGSCQPLVLADAARNAKHRGPAASQPRV